MDTNHTYYGVIDNQGRVRTDGVAMIEVRAVEGFCRLHRLTWKQAQVFGYTVRKIRIEVGDEIRLAVREPVGV